MADTTSSSCLGHGAFLGHGAGSVIPNVYESWLGPLATLLALSLPRVSSADSTWPTIHAVLSAHKGKSIQVEIHALFFLPSLGCYHARLP